MYGLVVDVKLPRASPTHPLFSPLFWRKFFDTLYIEWGVKEQKDPANSLLEYKMQKILDSE